MKTIVLILTTLCICFGVASVVEGQQQTKPPEQNAKTPDKKVQDRNSAKGPATPGSSSPEFTQLSPGATPLHVKYAKRTEWFHQFGSELRANFPDKDAVLVVVMDGIALEDFQQIQKQRSPEGAGTMYLQAGEIRRVFNIASSGTINGKPRIMLATTIPRDAAEVKLVIGEKLGAVVKLTGPIVPEISGADLP